MLIIISPSKTLDFDTPVSFQSFTQPEFAKEAAVLIKPLRKLSVDQLMNLMGISPKLARLNQERYYYGDLNLQLKHPVRLSLHFGEMFILAWMRIP